MVRQYKRISSNQRLSLIVCIAEKKMKITKAAAESEIPYENAKSIFKSFRNLV